MVKRIKRIKEEIVGVVSIMGSLYLLLSLLTHYLRDPVPFFRITEPLEPLRNLGGIVGAYLSGWLIILFGISAYLIPVFIIAFGIKRLLGKEGHKIYLLGSLLFLLSSAILLALLAETFHIAMDRYPDGIGGLSGRAVTYLSEGLVSVLGAYIFTLSAFLSSVILISPVSVTAIAFRRKKTQAGRVEKADKLLLKSRRYSSENRSRCLFLTLYQAPNPLSLHRSVREKQATMNSPHSTC